MITYLQQAEANNSAHYYAFCRSVFATCHIPSHNHRHHWRVWEYCKQLVAAAAAQGVQFSPAAVDALLAAALFHDTGLSRNIGGNHGKQSAAIYQEYIAANPHLKLALHSEVLEAILHHDDKEGDTQPEPFSVASILSVCDDLDAFGYIGAYRYIEIYCMRSVPIHQLATSIMANLDKRFATFASHYRQLEPFFSHHKARYDTTRSLLTVGEFDNIARTINQLAVAKQLELPAVVQSCANGDSAFWLALQKELAAVQYPLEN